MVNFALKNDYMYFLARKMLQIYTRIQCKKWKTIMSSNVWDEPNIAIYTCISKVSIIFPKISVFRFSFTTWGVHDMGSVSLEIWGAILYFQIFLVGIYLLRLRSYHHGIHHWKIHCNLSSNKKSESHVSITCYQMHHLHMGSVGNLCSSVPNSYADVLLSDRSKDNGTNKGNVTV